MDEFGMAMDVLGFDGSSVVTEFETEFATRCGARFAVGVGKGTDALWVALLAMGIGPGDEVITTPSAPITTTEAITYCGARPVFVDIEPDTYTLNPELLERAITSRTRAVIPVHLLGQCANMFPILEVAGKHGLKVIEDASQAFGAQYFGRMAGEMGDAGCFRFFSGRNTGAFGEAGAVATQDESLADRIRKFRDPSYSKKSYHDRVEWNSRLEGLERAFMKVKLASLEADVEKRRLNAARYHALLEGVEGVELPMEREGSRHVYHLYAIRTPRRDELMAELSAVGIDTGIPCSVPLHLQRAYAALGLGPGSFPVAERCAKELVSLPSDPDLTEERLREVAGEVKRLMERSNRCVRE